MGDFDKGVLVRKMDIQEVLDKQLGVNLLAKKERSSFTEMLGMMKNDSPRVLERRRYHGLKIDTY